MNYPLACCSSPTATFQAALWVAGKTLSRSWAAEFAGQALVILAGFTQQSGAGKPVHKAVYALYRHGATEAVRQALDNWETSGDENLQAAAEKVRTKINS